MSSLLNKGFSEMELSKVSLPSNPVLHHALFLQDVEHFEDLQMLPFQSWHH